MIRFGNVLKRSLQDVLKTPSKSLEDVLKMFWRCLEDVLKTSWRRPENVLKTSWRRMTKTIILVLIKMSWRRLLKTYELGEYIRLDEDVFKTSSEDEDERRLQDVSIETNVCWVRITTIMQNTGSYINKRNIGWSKA